MTYPVDTTAAPAKKPGPGLALSIITMVIGAIVGITGLAIGVTKVVHEFTGTIHHVSEGEFTQHLDSGTYELFVGVTSDTSNTLLYGTLQGFRVTDPSGAVVPLRHPGSHESIGRGSTQYVAVLAFTATSSGAYKIQITGNGAGSGAEPFFISRSFGDLAKHAAGWFALMGLGILIGFIGLVMLIAGIVRRRRARQPAFVGGFQPGVAPGYPPAGAAPVPPVAPGLPPPGWYPDPQIPGTNRYWDGTRWTDQTQTP